MREDRRSIKEWALSERLPYWEYYHLVTDFYDENNWVFRDGKKNPFAQLDWYKKVYGVTDTPEKKRTVRKTKDFGAGREVTEQRVR